MRRLPLIAPVLLAFAWGCAAPEDEKAKGKVPVYPVEGKLIVSGHPAGNARIAFHPIGSDVLRPVGITRPDGSFQLTTYAANDGAPEGEYTVTIHWPTDVPLDECECPDPAIHDRLFGAYSDPAKSQLKATIHPGQNSITLRASVGSKGWNLPRVKDGELKERGDR